MEYVDCIICGAHNNNILFTARDRLNTVSEEFSIVKCKNCGLMMTNPRPSEQEILNYYPSEYAAYKIERNSNTQHLNEENRITKLLKRLYRWYMNSYNECIPNKDKGKLLEIGTGNGKFLLKMKEIGWDVTGIEINKDCVDYLQENYGLEMHCGRLEDVTFYEQEFDLVYASMVLEHMHNPINTLKLVRRYIKPDGYLVFSIPNAGCWEFGTFKHNWYALQTPTHLYHFTTQTILKVLEICDFEIVNITHQRDVTNIVRSLSYYIEEKFKGESCTSKFLKESIGNYRIFSIALQFIVIVLSFVKQGGRLTIVAKPYTDKTKWV